MENDTLKSPRARGADLALALGGLTVGRKSSRLYALWPAIEERLEQGISHAQVLEFLNGHGFALTESTYKSYVYRFRKRHREQGLAMNPIGVAARPPASALSQAVSKRGSAEGTYAAAELASKDQGTSLTSTSGRPPSFEFDPMGISPDLLK